MSAWVMVQRELGVDLPAAFATGTEMWLTETPQASALVSHLLFPSNKKSSIHLRACRQSVCCRVICMVYWVRANLDTTAELVEERTFHDSRKLYRKSTISVSISKVKLEYSHVIHLKICFMSVFLLQ